MLIRSVTACAFAASFIAAPAAAQGVKPASDHDLREHLVWNSPWEGRALSPPTPYSSRTVFRVRRDELVAEVTSYKTNQRADSVVNLSGGRANWHDSNGAMVNVGMNDAGELVGSAKSQSEDLPIALRPRR